VGEINAAGSKSVFGDGVESGGWKWRIEQLHVGMERESEWGILWRRGGRENEMARRVIAGDPYEVRCCCVCGGEVLMP
jgi:hypothetical protein